MRSAFKHKCPILHLLLKHVSYKDIQTIANSDKTQTFYPAQLSIQLKGHTKGKIEVVIQSDTQLQSKIFYLFQIQDYIQWHQDRTQC